MIQAVNASGESTLVLDVRRGGDELKIEMNPVATAEGDYKLGLWIRDDTQGIGTMTYVDMNGNFGALGHGISDSDTGMLVDITEGELYETDIMGIEKDLLAALALCQALSITATILLLVTFLPTRTRESSAPSTTVTRRRSRPSPSPSPTGRIYRRGRHIYAAVYPERYGITR